MAYWPDKTFPSTRIMARSWPVFVLLRIHWTGVWNYKYWSFYTKLIAVRWWHQTFFASHVNSIGLVKRKKKIIIIKGEFKYKVFFPLTSIIFPIFWSCISFVLILRGWWREKFFLLCNKIIYIKCIVYSAKQEYYLHRPTFTKDFYT